MFYDPESTELQLNCINMKSSVMEEGEKIIWPFFIGKAIKSFIFTDPFFKKPTLITENNIISGLERNTAVEPVNLYS